MMIAITLFVVCCFLCNIGSTNFIPFNGQHPLNNPRYYFPYRQPYPSNLPIYRPNPRSNPSNLCNYWPRFCCGYLVVEKPGSCPNVSNWLQHQHYFLNYFSLCYSDSECPSHYKCCPGIYDTYKSCALPVPPSSSTPKPEFPPGQFPVEPKPEDGESREETTSNEYPVTRDPNEIDIEVGLRTDQTDKDDDEEEEGEGEEEEEEEGKKEEEEEEEGEKEEEEEGEKEEEEEDEEEDKLDSDGNSTENTNKEEEQTTLSNPNYVLPDAEISHETEDNDDNAEEKTGEDDDREIAEDKNEGDEKNEEIYDEENYDYDEEEEDDDYGDD